MLLPNATTARYPANDSPPRSATRPACFRPARLGRRFHRAGEFHESEEGMLTLATVITVLGLVVLIALLGNIGETVVEKIELQNDADAAAYSSALWMARGMNAVTTTNHLLGELTALCVLHEALGGPELDAVAGQRGWSVSQHHKDVDNVNKQIRQLEAVAPVTDKSPYWPFLIKVHEIDSEYVSHVIDEMAEENEFFAAGAMIYDAKVTLKRQLLALLRLKTLANAGYFVPPWIGPYPVGIVTAIAASGVHLYAAVEMALVYKEWLIIELIQEAAVMISPIKTETIEPVLIPALVNYTDQITKGVAGGGGSVVLRDRVQGALDQLDGRRGAKLSTFPAPRDLALPLVREPKPQAGGGPSLGDDPLLNSELDASYAQKLQAMQGALNNASNRDNRPENLDKANKLTERIRKLKQDIDKEKEDQKKEEAQAKEEEEKLKSENKPIPPKSPEQQEKERVRAEKLKNLQAEQDKLVKEREKIIKDLKVMSMPSEAPGNGAAQDQQIESGLSETDPDQNPTSPETLRAQARFKDPAQLERDVRRLEQLDRDMGRILNDKDAALSDTERQNLTTAQKQVQRELRERRQELQFARQDGGSSKMQALESLDGRNPSSVNLQKARLNEKQEKHTQWMRASYPHIDALRAPLLGMMNAMLSKSRAGQSYLVWSDRYSIVKPYQYRDGKKWSIQGAAPHLSPDSRSSQGAQHMYVLKDTYANANSTEPRKGFEPWRKGNDPAEKYFTVIGFAHRPKHDGLFSDVLFKSAHPEGTLALSQAIVYNANLETLPGSTQPGSTQPSVGWDTLNWETPTQAPEHGNASGASGRMWPWELFSRNSRPSTARNKVKLNWQAKLIPVTATRTGEARANANVSSEVKGVLKRAKKNFDALIQH